MATDLRFEFRIGMLFFGGWVAWFGAKGLFSGRFLIEDYQKPGGGTFPGQTYVDLQGASATLPSIGAIAVGLILMAFALFLPLRRKDDEAPVEDKPKHRRSGKRTKPKSHTKHHHG
jgi:hypothetical protein